MPRSLGLGLAGIGLSFAMACTPHPIEGSNSSPPTPNPDASIFFGLVCRRDSQPLEPNASQVLTLPGDQVYTATDNGKEIILTTPEGPLTLGEGENYVTATSNELGMLALIIENLEGPGGRISLERCRE